MAYQGGNVSNNAARRMLSAGRLKINELRNKVTELTVQLANVQSENKQLMRQQQKQVTCLCAVCLLCTSPDVLSPTHYVVIFCTNGSPYTIGPFSCLSVLSVCNVGVLWPNDWMHQDATWYGVRPHPRPHCVRWASSSCHARGTAVPLPLFGPLCSGMVSHLSTLLISYYYIMS